MTMPHSLWKPATILISLVATAGLVLSLFGPTLSYAVALALALASLGSLQYAFGRPRIPKPV